MTYRQEISPERVEKFRQAVYRTASEADRSKLGYIGLIGTALTKEKPVHDVDVLVFPSASANVGEAIISMNNFYHSLDARIQTDEGLYLATCPRKILEPEVNHIISQIRGRDCKISTHTLFFPDFRSFQQINPIGFLESITQNAEAVVGDFDSIRRTTEKPQKQLDPYFLIADFQVPLVADRYPKQLLLEKTQDICDYLAKHYGVKKPRNLPSTPQGCVNLVNEILLGLDKAN